MESMQIILAGDATDMGELRNAIKDLVRKPQDKKPFGTIKPRSKKIFEYIFK
jgi:hypothetical protein